MSKTLNLETFNQILFGAIKEEHHIELLKIELETAMYSKIQEMEKLVDALNGNLPYQKILKTINNIDINCDLLARKIEELEGSQKKQEG